MEGRVTTSKTKQRNSNTTKTYNVIIDFLLPQHNIKIGVAKGRSKMRQRNSNATKTYAVIPQHLDMRRRKTTPQAKVLGPCSTPHAYLVTSYPACLVGFSVFKTSTRFIVSFRLPNPLQSIHVPIEASLLTNTSCFGRKIVNSHHLGNGPSC